MMKRMWAWLCRKTADVYQKIKLVKDTPHRISLGFACGCMASFTPFFGFHFILGFVLAFLLRGNYIASALGTAVGNPLTFPLIGIAATALGTQTLATFGWHIDTLGSGFIAKVLVPYGLGGLILGLPISFAFYFFMRRAVGYFQSSRNSTTPEDPSQTSKQRGAPDTQS